MQNLDASRIGEALLAIVVGMVLSLLVPLLTLATSWLLPNQVQSGIVDTAHGHAAWLLLLGVLTAAFTEETLFRAYPLERQLRVERFPMTGLLLGLVAFTLAHAGSWNASHVFGVVLPLGAILAALYLCEGNHRSWSSSTR